MKTVIFLYAAICLPFVVSYSYGQSVGNAKASPDRCVDCNRRDAQKKKTGLWIENDGTTEIYYKAGLKDGVFKAYSKLNGKVAAIGQFTKGSRSGIWYYFDESGHLLSVEKDIRKNTDIKVKREDGQYETPPFRSYLTSYYPNGHIKEEGIALYDDSIEIDYTPAKEWKYYDENGKFTKAEKFE